MNNSMGHALVLLVICFTGAGLLLTLMTYAESTLDRHDAPVRALLRRLWHHRQPELVRVEAPAKTPRMP